MNTNTYPDLSDKVVVAYIQANADHARSAPAWILKEARMEEQAGRLFLVGRPAWESPGKPHWFEGATVNIPWDNIAVYLVYDSLEAYRRAEHRMGWRHWKRAWFNSSPAKNNLSRGSYLD